MTGITNMTDTPASIRELQLYLYYISFRDRRIPRVIPSGIYGSQTYDAVSAFQSAYGLSVTGITDLETWNAVCDVYNGFRIATPLCVSFFPSPDYVITQGEYSVTAAVIQLLLFELSHEYGFEVGSSAAGSYGDSEAEATKMIQKTHGLEQTGKVDMKTWNCIVRDYHLHSTLSEDR